MRLLTALLHRELLVDLIYDELHRPALKKRRNVDGANHAREAFHTPLTDEYKTKETQVDVEEMSRRFRNQREWGEDVKLVGSVVCYC